MNTYIALFRGINVGGKGVLPMQDLVKILESLGFAEVRTYIQSGNVVFRSAPLRTDEAARGISARIRESRGFAPAVLLLERAELQAAVEDNPFPAEEGAALHFFFLESPPQNPDLEGLLAVKAASEAFLLKDKVFYLYAPEGFGRSKLAAKVEQGLGVPATARNWNTVTRLMAMAGD